MHSGLQERQDDKRTMRRLKDNKAALANVQEARAVCVRGATLDSRVASLISDVGGCCTMPMMALVLACC